MTEADLLTLLRDCYEPGTARRNIVAAGLLRSATLVRDDETPGAGISGVPPRFHAQIALLAPGNDDAANAQLAAQIENRLLGVASISRVTVTMLPALFPILQ
jgi:hypothetical protein